MLKIINIYLSCFYMAFKIPHTNDFSHAVYAKLLKVPKGKVTTYAALARAVGTAAYRAVGTAMKNNPYMGDIPCHRVIKTDRSVGGFNGGEPLKLVMLKKEGITLINGKIPEEFILREL